MPMFRHSTCRNAPLGVTIGFLLLADVSLQRACIPCKISGRDNFALQTIQQLNCWNRPDRTHLWSPGGFFNVVLWTIRGH